MGAGVVFVEPWGRVPRRAGPGAPGQPAPCATLDACATIGRVPDTSSQVADLELLQRIAARDETALASLYDRHSSLAYGIVLRILRNPSDADEVLQETFVRIWTRALTYDSRLGSPAAWLTRIARNRAIDRLRTRQVRQHISVAPDVTHDGDSRLPEPEHHNTPEVVVQDAATAHALRSAMAVLPDTQRALIEAAFFDGYSHQELAARFGVPLGTVKTRIRTGLTTMRGRLEQLV
jgi:RNA polymerase sigma-70 factor, ECF subfamily